MGLPGGPVVKIPLLPMQGTRVRSLVRALRSHMLQGNSACAPQQEKSAHPSKDPVQPKFKKRGGWCLQGGGFISHLPLNLQSLFSVVLSTGGLFKISLEEFTTFEKRG